MKMKPAADLRRPSDRYRRELESKLNSDPEFQREIDEFHRSRGA
jgi:hypothetical protein